MTRLIIFFVLMFSAHAFSQDLSGKATYKTKIIFKDLNFNSSENKSPQLSPEIMKQVEEAMKKSSEKTYFLEFNKNESFYQQEEVAQPMGPGGLSLAVSFSSGSEGKLYKNLKEGYFVLDTEFMGKEFKVKDTLSNSGWELATETKQIGNYTAFKATKTIKAKELIDLDEMKDELSSDILSNFDTTPKDIVYTAWYTPGIPISSGPDHFGGLPGLILELHTPNMVYLCSEIVLNPSKKITIKEPKGKAISQKEFDKIQAEQMKKILKSSKSKSGQGNAIFQTISIGG